MRRTLLGISAVVTQAPPLRGMVAALLGLMLSTVGIDHVSGTPRFTFGRPELTGGIDFIAVMIGLFGLSEVLRNLHLRASLAGAATHDTDATRTQTLVDMPPLPPGIGPSLIPEPFSVDPGRSIVSVLICPR